MNIIRNIFKFNNKTPFHLKLEKLLGFKPSSIELYERALTHGSTNKKDKEGNPRLLVIDEGIGFSEKDTTKIFNRFYSNRPENFGEHSGLGLNIVKNLVELHNGQIKAQNNKEKGAKVEIIFPATQ